MDNFSSNFGRSDLICGSYMTIMEEKNSMALVTMAPFSMHAFN
jgi:hypothetical protein